jgi:hypothetical protein
MAYTENERIAATEIARRQGLPVAASIIGCSYQTVTNWCTERGIKPKAINVRKNLDPWAVAEYYSVHTGKDTAVHFGCAESDVVNCMAKMRRMYPTVFRYKLHNVPRKTD